MQTVLKPFIADFRRQIMLSRFKTGITSVVLLGSAARGSWIKGESDIDFIAIVRDKKSKAAVSRFLWKLIKKLDRKHRLHLNLSDKKYHNLALASIFRLETFFLQRVPFYILAEDEFDLIKNRVTEPKIWLITTFVGSLHQFMLNLKYTGKTLYGKNLLKKIRAELNLDDEIKMILLPYYYIALSLIVLPFSPKLAVSRAIKASLLETEDDLLLLHRKLGNYGKDEKAYEKLFPDHNNIKYLRKCLNYRQKLHSLKISWGEAARFLLTSAKFVATSHLNAYRTRFQKLWLA